jgi:phenylacetate-CoA ligase
VTATPSNQIDQIYERFAASLERTQWLPRASLDAHRDHLLGKLASFAFAHSPFYRERLKPLFHGTHAPDLRRWADIPILTRAEVEREIDRINPSQVPDELGPVLSVKTSGTTGERFSFRNSYLARMAAACMMQRLYRWKGFDLSAPLASIRPYDSEERRYPEGVTEERWAYPGPPAPHYTIDVRAPVAELIDWLARRRPTYLLTFPSIAHEIALHPDAAQVAKLGLKGIAGISEIVLPELRSIVRERLGCEIAQFYACAEIGCIAVQSPLDETCLVCEETALVELLDDDGKPVGPGETGRVVLTGFYNYATPFIRYAIGDIATWAVGTCPSGRALRRLQRIEGRTRNALIAADGRRIWPAAILTPMLFEYLPGRQFQIRQPGPDRIELLVPASGRATEPDRDRLTEYFSTLLGRPISLTVISVERAPRSVAGKFECVISSVSQ